MSEDVKGGRKKGSLNTLNLRLTRALTGSYKEDDVTRAYQVLLSILFNEDEPSSIRLQAYDRFMRYAIHRPETIMAVDIIEDVEDKLSSEKLEFFKQMSKIKD